MKRNLVFLSFFLFLLAITVPSSGFCFLQEGHPHPVSPAAALQPHPADSAKLEADKRFSEFNHRFAGVFVLLLGILVLLEAPLAKRFPLVRYLWFFFFFIPGFYLFLFSDPEAWPFGSQSLHHVVTQNAQVLQHKIFSLLLLGLSAVEYLRARGRLRAAWTAFLFPALAAAGALLLLYHSPVAHASLGPEGHTAMQKIEQQHLGFAMAGFGVAISKAFADSRIFSPRWMRVLFALFMVVLGMLLLTYTE